MVISRRRSFRIALSAALVAAGLILPAPAAAAGTATVYSYEHGDLAGSTAPYQLVCGYGGQSLCLTVPNLGSIAGPCKPWAWSPATWNDCISSVYIKNQTNAYLVVVYHLDASYSGGGWPYCVRPGTTWYGNVISVLNDRYSSMEGKFYTTKPMTSGSGMGNC
jgi:hypothetical protein